MQRPFLATYQLWCLSQDDKNKNYDQLHQSIRFNIYQSVHFFEENYTNVYLYVRMTFSYHPIYQESSPGSSLA